MMNLLKTNKLDVDELELNKLENKQLKYVEDLEKNKLLLNLSLKRYGEEERRNELIDKKIFKIIDIAWKIITIFSIVNSILLTLLNKLNFQTKIILIHILIISIIINVFGIYYLMKASKMRNFNATPAIDKIIITNEKEEYSLVEFYDNRIRDFNKAINENKKILNEKVKFEKIGRYCCLISGAIIIILLIICLIELIL